MKLKLLFGLLLFSQLLGAQSFTEVPYFLPPEDVSKSAVAFADINSDGYQDVLVTGRNNLGLAVARLYINNVMGIFIEGVNAPLEGVSESAIAFGDINNDGHQDVLITGRNNSGVPISKLYTNNGTGTFTEVMMGTFEGVTEGAVDFADVNGDFYQDVLITGRDSTLKPISKLYINNAGTSFTESPGVPFEHVDYSAVAFADINGDLDMDVLITGRDSAFTPISKLYINDGVANFTEYAGITFEGVAYSSVAIVDLDGLFYQDIFITGINALGEPISKVYTSSGLGSFTEVVGASLDGTADGSIAYADVDNDSDQDILITGENNLNSHLSRLYINDGTAHFSEANGVAFDDVTESSIAFSYINHDGAPDVLITGLNKFGLATSKLYINDSQGHFTELTGAPFVGVAASAIAFADVDGDTDMDVFISGQNQLGISSSKLYTNDGLGYFREVLGTSFEGVYGGAIAFADVDGDTDQDLFITGRSLSNLHYSELYKNDGGGHFTRATGSLFQGGYRGAVAFADVEGDNDLDLLISGASAGSYISKLYINNGLGDFTEAVGTPFQGVYRSAHAFADVDNDGDQDVLITGMYDMISELSSTKLYTNNGSGVFTEVMNTPFEGLSYSALAFADVDDDNDQDVLIIGANSSNNRVTKLYINSGFGNFIENVAAPFTPVWAGSVTFSDVDNDEDQDVLITGHNSLQQGTAKLYINDGLGNFTDTINTIFEGVFGSSVAFADINDDGNQDVLITGINSSNRNKSKLYINNGLTSTSELITEHNLDFVLYPNPTNEDNVCISYTPKENSLVSLKVYDLNGRLLKEQKTLVTAGHQILSIDISCLSPGIYFMALNDGKYSGTTKFIVK